MADNFQQLVGEFTRLADANDEASARAFLADNIQKFPEEVRSRIVFAFFEEALSAKAAMTRALAAMQSEGLQELKEILTEESELNNQERILELKSQLSKRE